MTSSKSRPAALPCPNCGHRHSTVKDSRERDDTIRRRRMCLQCGQRYTTFERVGDAIGRNPRGRKSFVDPVKAAGTQLRELRAQLKNALDAVHRLIDETDVL